MKHLIVQSITNKILYTVIKVTYIQNIVFILNCLSKLSKIIVLMKFYLKIYYIELLY